MADDKKWTCPKCQAENAPSFTHCRLCAEPKPGLESCAEKGTCGRCGHEVEKGKPCPVCGSPEFLNL